MKYAVSQFDILAVVVSFTVLVLAIFPPVQADVGKTFCERNPDSRVCKSAFDVARDERESLEDYCRDRPNTEKCKEKRTRDSVRKEKNAFCSEHPKQCARKGH
ncbi:MAG: hypothetical protein KDD60_05760 [Bdellovibrionales bacterium]|nr:hypothetical protein [Bdellovibrionales bacterium]